MKIPGGLGPAWSFVAAGYGGVQRPFANFGERQADNWVENGPGWTFDRGTIWRRLNEEIAACRCWLLSCTRSRRSHGYRDRCRVRADPPAIHRINSAPHGELIGIVIVLLCTAVMSRSGFV
jgi:hypothetical protein